MTLPSSARVQAAQQRIDALRNEEEALRRAIAELRRDLEQARQVNEGMLAMQLLEANEHLVVAALEAQAEAETAAGELDALLRASQRDVLCDVPNRALMLDRMESALSLARRHGTLLAVLFLDLDHFKLINDHLGHAVGDDVLRHVARRLQSVVRDSDTVSRHGGDEFLILLSEIAHPDDAHLIATKVLLTLGEPCRIGMHTLKLSASIGMALYPGDGEDAATLIARADAAMYRAKSAGSGRRNPNK